VVFYGVPQLWQIGVGSWLAPAAGHFVNVAFRLVAQLAAVILLAMFGMNLAGPNPPKGLRGAIFLGLSSIFTAFFLIRGLLMILERIAIKPEFGQFLSLAIVGACLFLFFRFLASLDRFQRWSVGLEASGWFDLGSYKRNQGLRVRRFTILGVLILLGSGVYTIIHNNTINFDNWTVTLPFTKETLTLLPEAQSTIPLLLTALTIWFAWRIVNYPVFADFLIATEAEINKVSWTSRPRLIQDTIVVLITVLIITLFLFLVDVFWSWILSREWVNVLPTASQTKSTDAKQVNTNEW